MAPGLKPSLKSSDLRFQVELGCKISIDGLATKIGFSNQYQLPVSIPCTRLVTKQCSSPPILHFLACVRHRSSCLGRDEDPSSAILPKLKWWFNGSCVPHQRDSACNQTQLLCMQILVPLMHRQCNATLEKPQYRYTITGHHR